MTLTADQVRTLLDYDPDTGIFRWRIRRQGVSVGGIAGSLAGGYCRIKIDQRRYLSHRLAWLHFHGEWPPDQIDHINLNKADNRIANLRLASGSHNCANRPSNRALGLRGTTFFERLGKWQASIMKDGKSYHLGFFPTAEAAHAAYCSAAAEMFGEFARST